MNPDEALAALQALLNAIAASGWRDLGATVEQLTKLEDLASEEMEVRVRCTAPAGDEPAAGEMGAGEPAGVWDFVKRFIEGVIFAVPALGNRRPPDDWVMSDPKMPSGGYWQLSEEERERAHREYGPDYEEMHQPSFVERLLAAREWMGDLAPDQRVNRAEGVDDLMSLEGMAEAGLDVTIRTTLEGDLAEPGDPLLRVFKLWSEQDREKIDLPWAYVFKEPMKLEFEGGAFEDVSEELRALMDEAAARAMARDYKVERGAADATIGGMLANTLAKGERADAEGVIDQIDRQRVAWLKANAARKKGEEDLAEDALNAQERAAKAAAAAWEREMAATSKRVQGYFAAGARASTRLSDWTPDISAPGANGPFEDIYRLQAWLNDGTHGDVAEKYGITSREQGEQIVRDFQNRNITPAVAAMIDIGQVVDQVRAEEAAEKNFGAFTARIAELAKMDKKTADVVLEKLFGVKTDDETGKSAAGAAGEKAAEAAVGGFELQVNNRDMAGRIIGIGETVWGAFETGFVGKAEKSPALQAAINGMVAAAIAAGLN